MLKRVISGFMVACITASSLFMSDVFLPSKVYAAETTGKKWAELSGILDSYKGVYTKDTKLGSPWNTTFSPDGPLMGNGTVFAFMAGDRKEQNIYISRSDMWKDRASNNGQQYTTFGGITIKQSEGENLALKKNVTVSGYTNSNEAGTMLVDGNNTTKWCSTTANNNNSSTYWAMIDLGEEKDISRWVVKHAQAGGESANWNTKDFKLQYTTQANPKGANEADWIDADTVVGNTAAITDRNLTSPIKTRYVRLLVTKGEQSTGSTARIYELELYEQPKADSTAVSEFRYEQDMKKSEVLAQSEQGFKTKTWLSAKENIIVTEISNMTDSPIPMEVSGWTANDNTSASIDGKMMIASKSGISKASDRVSGTGTWEGWTVNVSMASKIIDDIDTVVKNVDTKTNKTLFTLPANNTVTLVSAVEGGKQDGDINTMDKTILQAKTKVESRSTAEALAASNQAHRDYWKQYWLKSYINIKDEKVERMYYGMLYMLGCATSVSSENNAGLSAGLFPWTAADNPAWQGDYTTNTDMQRQIHPLVTANRLEGIRNYLNVLEDYWPEAQRRSNLAEHLNWVIDGTGRPNQFTDGIQGGALFPTHIGPWGASTEQRDNKTEYWNSPADASSVLMPIVKMWQYNQDEDYLREHLYPMLKSVAIFWENFVTFENNKYVVYGATHEGQPGRNPIFDIDACRYILKNAIDAANELGVDQDKVSKWQEIIDKMSPHPTFIWNGKETIKEHEGRTPENPGQTFDGNPVTIQSVYYYDAAGMSTPPEEKEKYINYLNVKNGIGSARRLTSATRLGYDINEIMEQLKIGSIDPTPSDWFGLRGNNTIGDIGAVNLLGVVQDSLLQSNEGFMNIFANWYDDQEASFKRLRAKGAFLVDANQNEFGQTTYVKILSEKGKDCSVLNPWQSQDMEVYEDGKLIEATKSENSLGEVYTFATKPNASYELKPKGGLSGTIQLDKSEINLYRGESYQLIAKTNEPVESMKWTSDNNNVAVVGKDGTVTAVGEGTATIKVYIDNDKDIYAISKVTVVDNTGANVALGKPASADSVYENFSPDRAVSGNWDTKYEGWVSASKPYDTPRWWMVDLEQEYTINRWVIKHDGNRGDAKNNTRDFELQSSSDGKTWTSVDPVVGNTENETDRTLDEPVTARYFRIYVTAADQYNGQYPNNMSRLNQVELYTAPELPSELTIAKVEDLTGLTVATGTAFKELNLPEEVSVTLSNGALANIPVKWAEGNYDGNTNGSYTLIGTLLLPDGIVNTNKLTVSIQVMVRKRG